MKKTKNEAKDRKIFNQQARSTQLVLAKMHPYSHMNLRIKQVSRDVPNVRGTYQANIRSILEQAKCNYSPHKSSGQVNDSLSAEKRARAIQIFNYKPSWVKRQMIRLAHWLMRIT